MQGLRNFIQEHLDNNETFYSEDKENSFLTFEEFVNKSNIILTKDNVEDMWFMYIDFKYNIKTTSFIKESQNYNSYKSYQSYIYEYLFENLKDFNKHILKYDDVKYSRFLNNDEFVLKIAISKNFDHNSLTFKNLLNKYNVFINKIINSSPYKLIYIEENDLDNLYNEVISKYNGILYHITTKENANKILKYGLEPRSENKKTWHPERIYFLNSDVSNNDIDILKKELYDGWKNKDLSILEIDIKKMHNNICIFSDKNVEFTNAYFTQESIPPYCIKEIYLSMFDKVKEKLFGFSRKLCKKFDKIIFK